jgi:3-hydroxybutyryl-CoA dehydratase
MHNNLKDIKEGDPLPEVRRTITQKIVKEYADASGDYNPLHLDPVFAEKTPYGKTIAHGMLILGQISDMMTQAFGNNWVNNGKLKVRFRAPVFIPNEILTYGKIKKVITDSEEILVECFIGCRDQTGKEVIKGDAYISLK